MCTTAIAIIIVIIIKFHDQNHTDKIIKCTVQYNNIPTWKINTLHIMLHS